MKFRHSGAALAQLAKPGYPVNVGLAANQCLESVAPIVQMIVQADETQIEQFSDPTDQPVAVSRLLIDGFLMMGAKGRHQGHHRASRPSRPVSIEQGMNRFPQSTFGPHRVAPGGQLKGLANAIGAVPKPEIDESRHDNRPESNKELGRMDQKAGQGWRMNQAKHQQQD